LQHVDNHYCGATLISELHGLTAAHCASPLYKNYAVAGMGFEKKQKHISQLRFCIRFPKI